MIPRPTITPMPLHASLSNAASTMSSLASPSQKTPGYIFYSLKNFTFITTIFTSLCKNIRKFHNPKFQVSGTISKMKIIWDFEFLIWSQNFDDANRSIRVVLVCVTICSHNLKIEFSNCSFETISHRLNFDSWSK